MQQSYMLQLPVSSHDAGLEWEIPHWQDVMQFYMVATELCWTAVNLPHNPSVCSRISPSGMVSIYTSFPTKPLHSSNIQASDKTLRSRSHQKTDYF